MENSLLSVVIIGRRNTSLSILHALNSILKQIYSPIKVLVVDANEPNSMYSLGLQEDLEAYSNVDYLQMDHLLSIAEIRNYTLRYVEGEYIAFLSSNDAWDSTKALLQIEQMKNEPRAAASSSNGQLFDKRKTQVIAEPLIEHVTYDSSKWVLYNPAKMSAQVIYRTEAIKEAGGFDDQFENFCDGDMLLRLSKENKVLILPISLCECNITPDNEIYDRKYLTDYQKIINKYMDLFLLNKRMTLTFYMQMIQLARRNYLWLNCFIYILLYFIKAPGRSTLLLVVKAGQLIRYMLKWLYRDTIQAAEVIRMRKDIHLLQRGKPAKETSLRQKFTAVKKEKPVLFSSARQYNDLNNLHFVFDHKLKSIVIPEYVTVIKPSMFYGCDQMVSVEIPNTVLEIQAHAFQQCKSLRHVTIQEGSILSKIGAYAFADCSALETISLPSSVLQIGKGAFFNCRSLQQVLFTYLHRGEERAGSVYPTAITKLSRFTFAGCAMLLAVEFGANSMLETIERGVFMGCTKLQKGLFTGNVKTLGSYAFAHCRELEAAVFPQIDTLKSIGKCAFMNCKSLTYFQLPNLLQRINVRTFYGCASLKQVKIPRKVLSINHQAFAKCVSLEKAIILAGDIAISQTAFEKHTELQMQENMEQETFSETIKER